MRCSPSGLDSLVGVVPGVRTDFPEAEFPRPRPFREGFEQARISPPAAPVEVGRSGANGNEPDVDVERAVDAHDVTQKPPIRARYCVTMYQTTITRAKARIANTATTINPAATPIRSKTKCAAHGSERLRGPVSPIAVRIQRRRRRFK